MNFKLESLLKEINKLRNEVSSYHSSKLVYNYFKLVELLDFYNYLEYVSVSANTSVSNYQMEYIKNYNCNLNAATSLSIYQNRNFYKKYSKSTNSKINDLTLRPINFKELTKEEYLCLIKEFLLYFDNRIFDYFNYMINESKIHFGKTRVHISYCGLTTLYSKKPYVICNHQKFNLISVTTMIHELGHVLNRLKTRNYSFERLLLIPGTLYEEVAPMFLEKLFLEYLISNDILKKEATFLKKDGFLELKEYAKLLYFISNIDNVVYDDQFHLKISSNKIKNVIKKLDIPYQNYQMQNLNIKEIIRYFNGIILGLEYVSEYRNKPNNNIYDFIANMDLIDDERVNILLKNSKVLEKEIQI